MHIRPYVPRRLWWGLLLTGLLLAGAFAHPALAKEPIHRRFRGFVPSGRYIVVRGGKTRHDAEVLHARRAAAFLVLDPAFDGGLLIQVRTSSVSRVAKADIVRHDDGGADLLARAKLELLGRLLRRRRDLLLRVEGYAADLQPNPPLLAWQMCDALEEHSPEYRRDAKTFRLDEDAVKRLQAFEGRARVNVYFGSWCPTCARYLGRILRLERAVIDAGIEFHYYGLPKPPAMYRDVEVRRHRIRKIPTGVIYRDNRKVGTIVSTQWNKPAVALADRLLGAR